LSQPEIPHELLVFLARALSREPSLRPESLVLLERLKAYLGDYGPGTPPRGYKEWR